MSKERNFEEDIKINKFQLEMECETQASTYLYYAQKNANAKSDLNDADDSLKLTISQVEMDYRQNWNETDWGKSTDKGIASRVETDERTTKAKKKVADLQREVNILSAGVSAMEHRKSELDNLTKLLIGGFYSAPNGGKREGSTEIVQREIRSSLKKKGGKKD
jgi:hypothetical protein